MCGPRARETSMEDEKTEPQVKPRKLYKSSTDRIVDGVCGGVAEYLGIDATVIRLVLVAFSILSIGAGVIIYIIGMAVIPSRPISLQVPTEPEEQKAQSAGGATVTLVLGIIIVIIGVTLLFNYYGVLPVGIVFSHLGRLALPIIFILVGGALLLDRNKGEVKKGDIQGESVDVGVEKKRLTRSVRGKKIAGVCGGLAAYLDVDPTIVRLACVILAIASFGLVLILYLACAFIIPKEVG